MDKFVKVTKRPRKEEGRDKAQDNKRAKEQGPQPAWTVIKRPQLHLRILPLLPARSARAREFYQRLEREVEYLSAEQSRVRVYGQWRDVPRKQAGYGDRGVKYQFSGLTLSAKPWCPVLEELRDLVTSAILSDPGREGEEGTPYFNFVLVNRYADGRDHAGEHRDDERELDPSAPIASLSLGAERDFRFRHGSKKNKAILIPEGVREAPEDLSLPLVDGTLLLMEPPTNHYWYHGLPVRKKCLDTRINLTFRRVVVNKKE